MATNNLSLLRKGRPFIMRGAYVATPVVAMSAPIVGSPTGHRATIKAHGIQIVAWYTPTTPKGADRRNGTSHPYSAGAASSAALLFKVCGFSESAARRDDSG